MNLKSVLFLIVFIFFNVLLFAFQFPWWAYVFVVLVELIFVYFKLSFRKIVRFFRDGNVSVFGLRGRGKDMLFANVVIRRDEEYVSNMNYGGKFHKLSLRFLDVGGNTYTNFIDENVKYYSFPFNDGTDVYLSDAGVYFPSQYCNELNKKYAEMPVFQALSRHVGDCNFHFNVQNLNRVWDKIREQSDTYLECLACKVIFKKVVLMKLRSYDKYDSAVNHVRPFKVSMPLMPTARSNVKIARQQFQSANGTVKNHYLCFINKSKYNTRYFEEVMLYGKQT